MPRQIKDEPIRTKTQRAKLKPRRKPYYRRLSDRLAIGYRRLNTPPGSWIVRERGDDGRYSERKLDGCSPDDVVDANGLDILTFDQACDLARVAVAPAPEEVTLRRAADEWAAWKISENDSPKRQRNFLNSANRHVAKFPDGILVTDITAKQVQVFRDDFLIGATDPRARRATANKQLAELKAILNRAVKMHGLDIPRPWDAVSKFARSESHGKRVIVFTPEERKALLDACPPDLHDLVKAALLTGCRPGELFNARCGDLTGRRLQVSGKTHGRTIVLSEAARDHLSALCGEDPTRHILLRASGEPWREDDQLGPFKAAVLASEGPDGATLYCARHTYITDHLSRGVPVTALAQQCGTSVEMVERTYANFLGDDLERWFNFAVV
ncbi:tyrosine-type recombinase/integrase [Shimia thalassica]|uniref:tyrosine-type recombinase/integrase n=1 Tax=Shimia thalassica TaxID=1715693 RepID=UPI0027324704|nr:tyrosine-type recombinase/integrase [Shimia thalassica]MDP2518834.1 tyrosine-type recombinase/integrase [Shimia thalassica]